MRSQPREKSRSLLCGGWPEKSPPVRHGAGAARLGALYTTSDYASVVSINLFVALLCACIVLGHLLEENRWVNESITALIIGLCTGVVILLMTKGKSSHLFVKKKQFFRNFMTITLFGAVGTMISFFTISIAIGAIFSATDSVCTLQVVIWWAGLMRGAVSIALAYNKFTRSGHTQLHGNAIMITSTITVVLFSTMVFGMMTKPLIRLLLPASGHAVTSEPSSPKSLHSPLLTSMQGSDLESTTNIVRPSSLRMLLTKPTHTVHYYWRKFDDALMRPMFGGRGFVPFSPGSPTEQSHHGGR
uniref:Cation/H+ exchanger domain-containing protein n=1 Tax=Oryza meridionalis TaxID=40149 RepID=A0A0E0EFV2_9ORYZ